MTARTRSTGMTLIETTVALALLALLSIGLVTSFRLGERVYGQVTRLDSSAWDTVAVQRFLRQALESAYPRHPHTGDPTTEFGLEGAPQELRFIAPMPQSAGAAGYYRYEVLVETTQASKNLIVRWTADRHHGGSWAAAQDSSGGSEVLIKGIAAVEWGYLQPPDPADGNLAAPRWLASWTSNPKLPSLVRLRVQFPRGDPRSWPELLVAPRIDADTSCRFDPVSQTCREVRS